jgi:hypothetical protein
MRTWVWIVTLAAAGCVSPAAGPPGVETVRVTQRPGVAAPAAQGEAQLVVRVVPAGVGGQELRGAACTAETPYFTAEFTSPARLLVPDYGAAAPPVVVSCTTGAATGTATAQPQAAWAGGMGGWPAVGVSVGTGNAGGVGVGFGWYGGNVGASSGVPVTTYSELHVPVG